MAGNALGFYDQRLIYLGLLLIGLVLARRLGADRPCFSLRWSWCWR
ncbi:MAG: hypothetical protein R3A10_21455 [Caldilineaceae bacterium]